VTERIAAPPEPEAKYAHTLRRAFAERYASGRDFWTREPAMRTPVEILCRALAGRPDQHVLDVGTGRGPDAVALLQAGHRVTGIDIVGGTPEWRVIRGRWGERVRLLETGLLDLPAEAAFDAALDNGCLHHQHPDGHPRYARHLVRLVRPGGLVAVSVFRSASDAGALYLLGERRLSREFTEPELVALFQDAGAAPVEARVLSRDLPGEAGYLVVTFRVGDG
jgi:SAM-dependent methyltransferase